MPGLVPAAAPIPSALTSLPWVGFKLDPRRFGGALDHCLVCASGASWSGEHQGIGEWTDVMSTTHNQISFALFPFSLFDFLALASPVTIGCHSELFR